MRSATPSGAQITCGLSLAGKVALVTGGSSGIGAATAALFGGLGADVAVGFFTNENGASEVVEQITRSGQRSVALKADVRRHGEVESLVDRATSELGPIDVLVNNAGIFVGRYPIAAVSEAVWDDVMDANLKGAVQCSRAVIPSMRARRRGAIVNVGSIAAHTGGGPGAAAYAAAKAGLIGFTKGLAKEVAADNIRVNAVSPGVIDTPMQRRVSAVERLARIEEQIPIGRLGTAGECAYVIAFLASEAASYIVGETIEVNGGLLMR